MCLCMCVSQEFDDHMGSQGHAANMQVMSAMYRDKNQQLLTSGFDTEKRKGPTGPGKGPTGPSTAGTGR